MVTRHPQRNNGGFTLIEILISLTILGFMLGILLLGNQGNGHRELGLVARNLQNVLVFTRDEAELQGLQLGVQLQNQQIQFMYLDEEKNEWSAYREREFEKVELPLSISLNLYGNDAALISQNANASFTKDLPDLLFFSSGEMNSYEIELRSEESAGRYVIASDGLNLSLRRSQPDPSR